MSHVFTADAAIPGADDDIQLLGDWPGFATVMTRGSTPTFDCRSPDRVRLPGQGRRPDKILASLRERCWHRRNCGLAAVTDGIVLNGGVLTAEGRPVMGVSQNLWEKKYAAADSARLRLGAPADRIKGSVAVLPFCRSARYTNYFHFFTEYLALAPSCVRLLQDHDIDRIVVTVDRPEEGSFHDGLLRAFFGNRFDDLVFQPGSFSADLVAFPFDRCGIYRRDEDAVRWNIPEGLGMTFMSAGLEAVFDALQPEGQPDPARPPILVVSRERAQARVIVNEAELVEALAPLGAVKVHLEDYPMPEQIRMVASARALVGCHGAGMVNAGFLTPGSTAIELTSRQYLPRAFDFGGLSGLRDIAYHFVLCDETGDFSKMNRLVGNVGNDITLPPAAIDRVVAILGAASDQAVNVTGR